jgi:hypothetical protein
MNATADSPTPVEDLLARARAYVTHSHAKNTLHAYAADWKHLLKQMVVALPDDLPGLRDKALLLIGFSGAFDAASWSACTSAISRSRT